MLTYERAHELFSYDTGLGVLIRKKSIQGCKPGSPAGSPTTRGYIQLGVDYRRYKAHRVIWLMAYGSWPEGEIDHIDGNTSNNRLTNLRDVDAKTNNRNKRIPTHNTSGIMGVHWDKQSRRWLSQAKLGSEKFALGRFDNLLDAAAARRSFEAKHFHANHGRHSCELSQSPQMSQMSQMSQ